MLTAEVSRPVNRNAVIGIVNRVFADLDRVPDDCARAENRDGGMPPRLVARGDRGAEGTVMSIYDDQALTVTEITDLMDRFRDEVDCAIDELAALRCVLEWLSFHRLIRRDRPRAPEESHPDSAEAGAVPDLDPAAPSAGPVEGLLPPDDTGSCADAGGGMQEIPSGPQDDADGQPADAAGAATCNEGPEGAKESDPAPVPPVAGGGTPNSVHPNAWSDDEDARAVEMKVAGRSNLEIAEVLGRSAVALGFRFSRKLKARLAAAREAAVMQADGDAHEAVEPTAVSEDKDGEPPATPPRQAAEVIHAYAPPGWHGAMSEREVQRHLAGLPDDRFWTPARDFALASALWAGEGAGGFAERLGITKGEVVARWRQLCPVVSLDNQQIVNRLLRQRAGHVDHAAEAAE